MPKKYDFKIKENEEIIDTVEKILELNQLNQSGLNLKILTPSQMLGRLPISLAQLKAWNNSEKVKNEIRKLLYSLYQSKKLTKISRKVWSTFLKHENNLYEHSKE